MPSEDSEGNLWYVHGMDSIKEDTEEVCHHTPDGSYGESDKYLVCLKCRRHFQKIHPTTAERIIRDLEMRIERLNGMIFNV
jgi:hypothetical protein